MPDYMCMYVVCAHTNRRAQVQRAVHRGAAAPGGDVLHQRAARRLPGGDAHRAAAAAPHSAPWSHPRFPHRYHMCACA